MKHDIHWLALAQAFRHMWWHMLYGRYYEYEPEWGVFRANEWEEGGEG